MTNQQRKDVIELIKITFENGWNTDHIITPPWSWNTFSVEGSAFEDVDYEENERKIDKLFELELKRWRYHELVDYTEAFLGYNGIAWKLLYKIPISIPDFYQMIHCLLKEYTTDIVISELDKELFDYAEATQMNYGEIATAVIHYEQSMKFDENLFVFYPSLVKYLEYADFSHVINPSDNEDEPIELELLEDSFFSCLSDFCPVKDGVKYKLVNYGEDELSLIPFEDPEVVYLWNNQAFATREEAIEAAEENAEEA